MDEHVDMWDLCDDDGGLDGFDDDGFDDVDGVDDAEDIDADADAGAEFDDWGVVGDSPGLHGAWFPRASHDGGTGPSSLQLGTAVAFAGHLLDRQAERIVSALRAEEHRGRSADPRDPVAPPFAPAPRPAPVAPRPATPSATPAVRERSRPGIGLPKPTPIDWTAPPLQVGDVLSRSRLATTIAVRLGAGHALALVARPIVTPSSGADRSVTVMVHASDRRKPIHIRFAVGRGGFDVDLLRAVFDVPASRDDAAAGFDDPRAAVDALEWALDRHDLALSDHRWAEGR